MNHIADEDRDLSPEQIRDLAAFERETRGDSDATIAAVPELHVPMPPHGLVDDEGDYREPADDRRTFEQRRAERAADALRSIVAASRGLLVPTRIELDEDSFGAHVRVDCLAPAYASSMPNVKATSVVLTPALRPVIAHPYVLHHLHGSARLERVPQLTDADAISRAVAIAQRALVAYFTHLRNCGWASFTKAGARPELDGHTLACKEALHFCVDELGLDMLAAKALIASTSRVISDGTAQLVGLDRSKPTTSKTFPNLDAIAKQVEGERALWPGKLRKEIEAQAQAERASVDHAQRMRATYAEERTAPAIVNKSPGELGAIVLTRRLGDSERTRWLGWVKGATDGPNIARGPMPQESFRDGTLSKTYALPVLVEVVALPDGLVVEEQIAAEAWATWDVAPADVPYALSAFDLKCIGGRTAERFITDAIVLRARKAPNAEAPVDRTRLRNASIGVIASMSLRSAIRSFIKRHAVALTLEGSQRLFFARSLHQAIVRGMLVDPLFAAAELRRAAKKIEGVTPWAREWCEAFFQRVDDGEMWVKGGLGCFVAPGALTEKGGA